jgi:predicted secreted protein
MWAPIKRGVQSGLPATEPKLSSDSTHSAILVFGHRNRVLQIAKPAVDLAVAKDDIGRWQPLECAKRLQIRTPRFRADQADLTDGGCKGLWGGKMGFSGASMKCERNGAVSAAKSGLRDLLLGPA